MDPFDQRVAGNSSLVLNSSNRHSGRMQRLDLAEQGLPRLTAGLTSRLSVQGRSSGAASRTLALTQ